MPVTRLTGDDPVRSIWFGMRCAFTRAALEGATASGDVIVPVAVVLPRGPVPSSSGWPQPPFDRWLRDRGIETIEVERLADRNLLAIEEFVRERNIDLGVGACFPWKMPARLREALPGGVLNIHPSLLPTLRGPKPVFHAYRQGLDATGVTVHLMDDGWDSGPIVAQEGVTVPASRRDVAFEADLARRGGSVLAGIARLWLDGAIAAQPQDESRASWAPMPDLADRRLLGSLTVAQAARFVIACSPLTATDAVSGARVTVNGVVATGTDVRPPGIQAVRVRCRDGDLWLRPAGDPAVAETVEDI